MSPREAIPQYREDVFNEALSVGVKGYVLKDSAATDIIGGIRSVLAGQYYISPAISDFLVNRGANRESLRRQRPGLDSLTPSERRVLRLIADGKTSKEIAADLGINYRTVENHRTNINTKLDIQGSHSLLRFALENKSLLA